MKIKPTLIAVAVASVCTGSVLAQTSTAKSEQQAFTQFNRTGVVTAWGRGFTGQGLRVAVLDSGFDLTHTDLKGQVALAKNFNQASLNQISLNTNNIRSQLQGGYDITWGLHGTQMASIVAGRLDNNAAVGVAHNAQLLLAQIGEGVRYNTTTKAWTYNDAGLSMTGVYSALKWAEANGAVAANMSFGSTYDKTFQSGVKLLSAGLYQAPTNYGSMYGNRTTDLMNFVNSSKSMVLVAAAGNQGLPYAQFPGAFATQVDTNGNLLLGGRMLIVGSVNANNVISSFSNRAGSFCTNLTGTTCNDKYYVKDFFVVAPGEAIISSIANQAKPGNVSNPVTGTSPAAAYVSGGVALIKNAWPQLTAAQIVNLVKTTATDLGAKGVDEVYGYGLVNFDKATQPTGTLTVAKASAAGIKSGTASVNTTGVTTSGSAGLGGSSVLSNVMAIDGISRHYGVDLTKASVSNSVATYQFGSAWLALTPAGYHEQTVPLSFTYSMKFMRSNNGNAVELQHTDNDTIYSVQVGSMREQDGFLGNYGSGALSFGNSSTSFTQVGVSHNFNDTVVFGSYGMATTRAGSVADSLVQLDSRIASQTWRVGVGQRNFLQSKDQLSLSLVSPVTVHRGNATVTAVTDYRFTEDADGNVHAHSVVTTEKFSLRPQVRPMDLVLGYTLTSSNTSRLTMNLARQYNVSGQGGQTATGFSMTFNKFF